MSEPSGSGRSAPAGARFVPQRGPWDLSDTDLILIALALGTLVVAAWSEARFGVPSTAKTHVNRAMMKIGARDRAQLVVFAYENGLMVPGRSAPA
jgi:hypothetical protein